MSAAGEQARIGQHLLELDRGLGRGRAQGRQDRLVGEAPATARTKRMRVLVRQRAELELEAAVGAG